MTKVSVDLTQPTPYLEQAGRLGAFKRRLTHQHYIRLIRRHLSPQQRASAHVLDVGTGSGSFLAEVRRCFATMTLSGLEYDDRLVAQTNAQLGATLCQQGNAETFDLGRQFDLITSFQVIEHLYNPTAFVANCRKHLKPGGVVMITTPNLGCVSKRVMKEKWHGFREDHVSLKTAQDWKALMVAAGLIPLYTGTTFFSGIPVLNRLPLGVINWSLLLGFGSLPWSGGEAFVGVFRAP
jgi:2-polyprenyl-3-methyl-5-hydroxy-6-metoxy-1,4-benzoquinol methylase